MHHACHPTHLLLAAVANDGFGLDDGRLSSLQLGLFDRLHDGRGVGTVRDHLRVPPVRLEPVPANVDARHGQTGTRREAGGGSKKKTSAKEERSIYNKGQERSLPEEINYNK